VSNSLPLSTTDGHHLNTIKGIWTYAAAHVNYVCKEKFVAKHKIFTKITIIVHKFHNLCDKRKMFTVSKQYMLCKF